MTGIVEGEEELGIQKRCPRCTEWLPLDEEFWYFARRRQRVGADGYLRTGGRPDVQPYCRACWSEKSAAHHLKRKVA